MNLINALKKYTLPLVLMAWCSSALAVSLTDFQAQALSGDRTQLELTFDGPAPTPVGYSIENPARISLDFRDTDSLLDNRYVQIGTGNTRNAAIVSSGGRTRIVLSLSSLVPYATAVSGNTVQIVVGEGAENVLGSAVNQSGRVAPSAATPVASAQPSSSASRSSNSQSTQASNSEQSELVNVDFRRSEGGAGQVILEFSNNNARTDIIERGGSIVVELEDFDIPRELRRRLDVIDFATSVHYINVYREDQNGIVELELDGAFDYLAYQTDNRMTIEVQTVTPAEAQARQEAQFPYSGERLSLSFQDIEVRNVLQLIADYVGLNLVASDSISGNITLRLQNVPWDQALDLVLKTKGLDKRQTGNVLLVGPAQEIAERERLELESQQQIEQLAPLVTEFVQINYAKAADILNVLQTGAGGAGAGTEVTTAEGTQTTQASSASGFLSSRGSASADTRTNTLIIRDTANNLDRIREAIEIFDRPVRQVLIEARIVAARTSVGKELGIRWGGNVNSGGNFPPVVASGSLDSTSSISSDLFNSDGTSYTQSYPDALAVNLPAGGNASSFAIGVTAFDYALDLELSALETRGSAEVVSQPKIVTSDGQEAYIISGQSIPFQGVEGETIFRDAGLSLRVTPQITPDNRVILDLVVTQDSLAAGGNAIDTNSVTTQVLVNNGDTLVLGGVYRTESVTTIDKTPLLGDLPVLGTLFRRTSSSEEKTELLIFITPKLVQEGLAAN
ncbi:type IV pilus secretin PilQ [Saccharospirillum sp.]|uniref:type IV pilus secretin PilQ n=1 Tax=Saccharospirillum sp. TaxID=2033801 RepID=UPI00349FF3B3